MSSTGTRTGLRIVSKVPPRCASSYAPTSSAVSRKSTSPILMYRAGPGCECSCGSRPSASGPCGWVAWALMSRASLHQVDDGEDHDPDDVDEVPVERRHLEIEGLRRRELPADRRDEDGDEPRSEEHTSELQSRLHLVCR